MTISKSISYAAGALVTLYLVLIALNLSVGYRECRAIAIHEIVYSDQESIDRLSPCWAAYAIRG